MKKLKNQFMKKIIIMIVASLHLHQVLLRKRVEVITADIPGLLLRRRLDLPTVVSHMVTLILVIRFLVILMVTALRLTNLPLS